MRELVESDRYADPSTCSDVIRRLKNARMKGFTRPLLQQLMQMNGSAVWRAQTGRLHPNEVDTVVQVLDRIERGDFRIVKRGRRTPEIQELRPMMTGVKGINPRTGTVHLTETHRNDDGSVELTQRCNAPTRVRTKLETTADSTDVTCGSCKKLIST